jgi:glycosyltransferase involved in cell wall biosynthesis
MPVISIIIPCRNEKSFISGCIKSLLDNTYPGEKTEIIVVDGDSNDGTLDLLKKISEENTVVRVVSNPKRIFPAAVNTGIRNSTGEYIFIVGAHAEYPQDYISKCIEYSIEYDADNIGGVLDTVPFEKGFIAGIITCVLSNPFGVGNSKFRTGTNEITETDTVFGGCYKRSVFDRWGFFNENLISTSYY